MRSSNRFILLALFAAAATPGFTQTPSRPDPSPAPAPAATTNAAARPTRPAPIRSPEVHDDRRVTVRLRAAHATEVLLAGQWSAERVAMSKDTEGVWSVTVGPIPSGVWEYSLVVDGLTMIDPGNPAIKPMREPRTSILHLPGEPAALHDFQDVPHGVVRFHSYRSRALGRTRELAVYTPPGYDERGAGRFPTLYLQHGSGDNHATWTAHGKAHWILDNLISQGRAEPMVVVMMDGHAALGPTGAGRPANNTELYERDLLEEVLPWIESTYRVRKNARSRAIAGLSMGGGQSLTVGLKHTDQFAWIAGFSASVPSADALGTVLDPVERTNRRVRLLWIACGKDDFLLARNREFIALLEAKGIHHEWLLTEGNHSWPVWRTYLADLAPRLFREP